MKAKVAGNNDDVDDDCCETEKKEGKNRPATFNDFIVLYRIFMPFLFAPSLPLLIIIYMWILLVIDTLRQEQAATAAGQRRSRLLNCAQDDSLAECVWASFPFK